MGKRRRDVKEIEKPRVANLKHVRAILAALESKPVDVAKLRSLAHLGFVDNDMRKRVWPHLLGIKPEEYDEKYAGAIKPNQFTVQIAKDVERSLFHHDVTRIYRTARREEEREKLSRIMNCVFSVNSQLFYSQGYHDVCSIFLLVCGEPTAYLLSERILLLHMREFARSEVETVINIMNLVFPLIQKTDSVLHKFLVDSGVPPFFTLSWIITWFSHSETTLESVARVYDFLLASHPMMILYMVVVLIMRLRDGLLRCECDAAMIHQFFQKYPKKMDYSEIISQAQDFFFAHPPHTIFEEHKTVLSDDSPFWVRDVAELVDSLKDFMDVRRLKKLGRPIPLSLSRVSATKPFKNRKRGSQSLASVSASQSESKDEGTEVSPRSTRTMVVWDKTTQKLRQHRAVQNVVIAGVVVLTTSYLYPIVYNSVLSSI